ncbi:FAD-dependent oxidoreductase [Clostridium sediminicola]|uniref:NAD(P)/FAD-dependent oxidoreductase n=1 Tax=Clostridium sediminicola TaxID=3114879 RepID=UPI0031F225C2
MNFVTGDMLWTSINKIKNKYQYLSEDIECDVAIIGAGITGAIAAYYLTEEGINTAIIDKNIIGFGSTRASTSILQYEIDTDLIGLKSMIGAEKALKCFKLCEKAVYDIENIIESLDDNCDFSLKECFYYTSNSSKVSSLEKEYNLRKQNGFDVTYINKDMARKKFSFPVEGGILSNSGAAQIDPFRFTHALISKSVTKGLSVYENTEIDEICPSSNSVSLKTTNNFIINAKKIIIAAGYESKKYVKEKIVNLSRTFTIVTKPLEDISNWYNKCIVRDNDNPYIYFRTTGDNRIIIGGEDEKIGGDNSKMSCLINEDKASINKYNILYKKLKSYFPQINNLEIEYRFSGLFGDTKDGLPFIGEYNEMPNCYFSLGYGSNGIIYAILGGQIIRDLYLKKESTNAELFRFNR